MSTVKLICLGTGKAVTAVYHGQPSSAFAIVVDEVPVMLVGIGLGVAQSCMKHLQMIPSTIYVSHNHTDHAGELPLVLSVETGKNRQMKVIAEPTVLQRIIDYRMAEYNESLQMSGRQLSDLATFIPAPEMQLTSIGHDLTIIPHRAQHSERCFGFVLFHKTTPILGYSADSGCDTKFFTKISIAPLVIADARACKSYDHSSFAQISELEDMLNKGQSGHKVAFLVSQYGMDAERPSTPRPLRASHTVVLYEGGRVPSEYQLMPLSTISTSASPRPNIPVSSTPRSPLPFPAPMNFEPASHSRTPAGYSALPQGLFPQPSPSAVRHNSQTSFSDNVTFPTGSQPPPAGFDPQGWVPIQLLSGSHAFGLMTLPMANGQKTPLIPLPPDPVDKTSHSDSLQQLHALQLTQPVQTPQPHHTPAPAPPSSSLQALSRGRSPPATRGPNTPTQSAQCQQDLKGTPNRRSNSAQSYTQYFSSHFHPRHESEPRAGTPTTKRVSSPSVPKTPSIPLPPGNHQNSNPRKVSVFDNDDKGKSSKLFVLNSSIRTLEQLKMKVSESMNIKPFKHLYSASGHVIRQLEELHNGQDLVATKLAGAPFDKRDLPRRLAQKLILANAAAHTAA